jgi:hypothetical protein
MNELRMGTVVSGRGSILKRLKAVMLSLALVCVAMTGIPALADGPVGGYPPDAEFDKGGVEELIQPIFVNAVPRLVNDTGETVFETSVYTFTDIIVFSYFDDTAITITRASTGAVVYDGVLAKDTYRAVSALSTGLYYVTGSKSYTVLIGDAVTTTVQGYYAVDQSGRGTSTLLNTYMMGSSWGAERFIVFAYEDDTTFTIKNLANNTLIAAGTLNKGQHYTMPQTPYRTFLQVGSNKPVSALSYADQDYYVPSANGTFTGELFYGYSGYIGSWTNSITVTAYHDDTQVVVKDKINGVVLDSYTLNTGQVNTYPVKREMYWQVESTKPVTAANIPFAGYTGNYAYMTRAIDSSGTGAGTLFYVPAIGGRMDIFSIDSDNQVRIERLGDYKQYPYTAPALVYTGLFQAGSSYSFNTPAGQNVYKITGTGNVSVVQSYLGWGADFMPLNYTLDLPDLAISSSDIEFSIPDDMYVPGEPLTVTLTVHNIGGADAENVVVHAYDGDPDNGGTVPLLAQRTLALIPANTAAQTTFSFIVPADAQYRTLVIKVDPDDAIAEGNESNNKASRSLVPNQDMVGPLVVTVAAPAGLDLDGEGGVTPNPFTVSATILNAGVVTTTSVVVELVTLDGLVLASGDLALTQLGNISGGQQRVLNWMISADVGVPGANRYDIRVVADNAEEKTVRKQINVPETRKPTIVLEGDAMITVECNVAFDAIDPGVVALDIYDNPLNVAVSLMVAQTMQAVDIYEPLNPGLGILVARYTALDAYGEPVYVGDLALEAARYVEVQDTTPPTLMPVGDLELTIVCGDTYEWLGALALDVCDGDLTDAVVVEGAVDPQVPGIYPIVYMVADAAGNEQEATRLVTVLDDAPPAITLLGDAVVTIECGGQLCGRGRGRGGCVRRRPDGRDCGCEQCQYAAVGRICGYL